MRPEHEELALAPEAEQVLRTALASGRYASPGEILSEALIEWQSRHAIDDDAPALRLLWEQGLASGAGADLDIAALKALARDRLARQSGDA